MYLTKKEFINNNRVGSKFVIKQHTNLVVALDNQILENESTIILEKGSALELLIICDIPLELNSLKFLQQSNSKLKVLIISSAQNYLLTLSQLSNGSNADFKLYGLSLNSHDSSSQIKIQSTLDYNDCKSEIIFKNTLEDNSNCNFIGKIEVTKNANNCEVYLENKNLLESLNSKINSQPILQIYNSNVKAMHAATTGFLKVDELLYLQTRGLSLIQAKEILIQSFNEQIIKKVDIVCFQERFRQILNQKE